MNEDPNSFYTAMSAIGAFVLKVFQSHFFIGLVGAVISLRGIPGATWRVRYFNAMSGMVISGIGTPALAAWFAISDPEMMSVMAFALGLFGLNLVDASRERAVELIRTTKLSDILPWSKKGD